jgi:hypothetical protein
MNTAEEKILSMIETQLNRLGAKYAIKINGSLFGDLPVIVEKEHKPRTRGPSRDYSSYAIKELVSLMMPGDSVTFTPKDDMPIEALRSNISAQAYCIHGEGNCTTRVRHGNVVVTYLPEA